MKINAIHHAVAGFVFAAICVQPSMASETAVVLYKQCKAIQTTVEQRACYPVVVRQSEVELVAAETVARAAMVRLENISPSSRSMHAVRAFDIAKRAYRAFRSAESNRVSTSYGSGNGGGLAANQAIIEMNLARIEQLKDQ